MPNIWNTNSPDHPSNPQALERYIKDGISTSTLKCILIATQTTDIGYLFMTFEKPISRLILEGGVHSKYRGNGLGKLLLKFGLEEGDRLAAKIINVPIPQQTSYLTNLLSSLELKHVRTHWQMKLPKIPVVAPTTSDKFQLAYLSKGQEQILATLQNNCFQGTWGFSPNTSNQIQTALKSPGNYPNGVLILLENGQPVAYNWTLLIGTSNPITGVISMTGVLPKYRGLGLGKFIVTTGINQLQKIGADSTILTVDANNIPARELYLKIGFQTISQTFWYSKTIQNQI